MNDLPITTLLCLVLLLAAILGLSSLVVALLVMNQKSQNRNQHLVVGLLHHQTRENQSLRNQLRAADVVSLHGLNAATVTPQGLNSDPEWIPTYDESVTYQEQLDTSPYGTQEPTDDLAARGWDPIVTSESDGGSPVRTS